MSRIRPLEPGDVEQVARLYEDVVRDGSRAATGAIDAWLRRVVLHNPWADDEIPSLVATGPSGEVVGFLASHVRHLLLDGRPVRLGCSGHLVVAEHARSQATGAMLVATYLKGPQELTTTDGATAQMARLWQGLGGEVAPLQQLTWVRPVAPWRHPWRATGTVVSQLRRRAPLAPVTAPLPLAPAAPPGLRVQPLTASSLAASATAVGARLRLRPVYAEREAAWLLDELAAFERGLLRAATVEDADGAPLGHYAYYAVPGGVSEVVSVAAVTDEANERVLDALLADARACGVAAVTGRVEPRLTVALGRRRAVLRRRRDPQALVHAHDPEVLLVATSRHALLTRMEGEWCLVPPAHGRGEPVRDADPSLGAVR